MKAGLIGKKIKIVESKNKSLSGIEGIVIDETRNTFTIENGVRKKIIKEQCIFEIDGKIILGKEIIKNKK